MTHKRRCDVQNTHQGVRNKVIEALKKARDKLGVLVLSKILLFVVCCCCCCFHFFDKWDSLVVGKIFLGNRQSWKKYVTLSIYGGCGGLPPTRMPIKDKSLNLPRPNLNQYFFI